MDMSYLMQRGEVWWYNRRVPKRYRAFDKRDRIRMSLDTYAREEACMLRDKLVEADNRYWAALALAAKGNGEGKDAAHANYQAAVERAQMAGFVYRPVLEIAAEEPIAGTLERLLSARDEAKRDDIPEPETAEVLLGGVSRPKVRVSEALEIYFNEIALDEQMYKSPQQKASWRKVKTLAVTYFIEQCGDLVMEEITREHALAYKAWWAEQVAPSDPSQEPLTGYTANRRIGGIRSLYRDYFEHIGEEDRQNPFRKISFKARQKTEIPAFESHWVQQKILQPGIFSGLRAELQLIIFILIETGCRPSEIINLRPEDIRLSAAVPHITIRSRSHGEAKREVKTASSEREVPLVGVALEAAKRAGAAFPHYQDRNELFSANVMQGFRRRDLFPTPAHRIYSFRHAFEKRMQEANIDYGLRCLLMGHKTDRPSYGDGGSLAYRRDELMKIVHPYDVKLFEMFDAEHDEWGLAS